MFLARHPEFFIVHHSYREDLVFFVAGLFLAPALLLWLLEKVSGGLGSWARSAIRAVVNATLVTLIAGVALKGSPIDGDGLRLAVSLSAGLGLALWYERRRAIRGLVRTLALAPPIFIFLFAATDGISPLLRHADPEGLSFVDGQAGVIPVVMVIFDSMGTLALLDEDDHIDSRRFPNLARLADQSTWFRNASTVHTYTKLAVPVILTGRYPNSELSRTYADQPENLFALLAGSHDLNIVEYGTRFAPPAAQIDNTPPLGHRLRLLFADVFVVVGHLVLPNFLRDELPPIGLKMGGFTEFAATRGSQGEDSGPDLTERAAKFRGFIDSIGPCYGACFHYLHTKLPHRPWHIMPTGEGYLPKLSFGINFKAGTWSRDPFFARQGQERYLLQLEYVDRMIGELIEHLHDVDLYDRSLILFTSDHGTAFVPGEHLRMPSKVEHLPEVIQIPLIVKLPHQSEGRIDDRNVETIDILPLIADVLSRRVSFELDGCSPFDAGCKERTTKRLYLKGDPGEILELPNRLFDDDTHRRERYATPSERDSKMRIGPHAELIDLPLSRIPIGPASELTLSINSDAEALPSGYIAAGVWGTVRKMHLSDPNPLIGISRAGRVQAVVPSLRDHRGRLRFLAILPEAEHPHAETLRFFEVSGRGESLQFDPITIREK